MLYSKKPSFSVDMDVRNKESWKFGQLLSVVEAEHPQCRVWAEGQKFVTMSENEKIGTLEIQTTSEGPAMMSCKYARLLASSCS